RKPRPFAPHRVVSAIELHQRPTSYRHGLRLRGLEAMLGQRQHEALLFSEALTHRAPRLVALLDGLVVEPLQQLAAYLVEVLPHRDRYEMLPAHALAPRLDAALVVAGRRPREARLEEVVVGQPREASRPLSPGA